MKTPSEDPLDELLSEWQVPAGTPASFQREVWARIAAAEADPGLWERVLTFLLRPRGWMATCTAAILLGAGVAWMETRPRAISPHEAYVRSISPFASLHLASH